LAVLRMFEPAIVRTRGRLIFDYRLDGHTPLISRIHAMVAPFTFDTFYDS